MWSGAMALRLACVRGAKRLTNDLVYCPPLQTSHPSTSTVVFFPGDVQNFPEDMKEDADNVVYLKWNLVDTALMLKSHYKTAHVIVIKPSRVEFNVYSCYDNFLRCDKFGSPQKGSYVQAIPHLEALLNNCARQVSQQNRNSYDKPGGSENEENWSNDDYEWKPRDTDITLIGFSKGCVVLNQLVYEMCGGTQGDFLKNRISCVNWLDGGHGGTSGAWITQRDVLSFLGSFPWQLRVEVTPYQVERREWVKREEKIFSDTLLQSGADFQRRLHFASSPPSLLNHFRILDVLYSDP